MSWAEYDDKKADEARSGGFEPIPVGTALSVRISEATSKTTRTGGEMVQLTLTVIAGPHKSRKIWHNLHVVNRNEAMQHRDRRTLQDIAKIVYAGAINGESGLRALKGRDLLCTVIEHEQDEYNGRSQIKERVGKFRTDPDARNVADEYDDDMPF